MKEILLSWGTLVLSVIFNVFGVFVIKLKMNELGPVSVNSPKAFTSYFLLLLSSKILVTGVILFFISPFIFAVALSRMELTVAYPVQILLNLLFLAILAVMFLGEGLTITKIAAMILAFVSIYLLNVQR
jgi:multidrug transporter EmrE-like cation transporter